jgi:hypothetical protein
VGGYDLDAAPDQERHEEDVEHVLYAQPPGVSEFHYGLSSLIGLGSLTA